MKYFIVESGDLKKVSVFAEDVMSAAVKAIKEKNPKSLGTIISVKPVGGECLFMATENLLKSNNMWYEIKET